MTQRYAGPFGGIALPCSGAPGDQPAALFDAMLMLDRLGKVKDG